MNPQIQALYDLQKRDRQLTVLEHKLALIPDRLRELTEDLKRLDAMLDAERSKCDDTRAFQKTQENQLIEEEEMLHSSRAKMQQIKNPRELSALQREIDSTKRMSAARTEEIEKIKKGVLDAEARIAAMKESFEAVKTQGEGERERLGAAETRLEAKLGKLKMGREALTSKIDVPTLRTYDRIRGRVGGIAFVPASEGRCTACKMHVPHQTYTQLRKGDEILSCESCGRLVYWGGHFNKEEADAANNPGPKKKASPPQKRPTFD